MHHAQVIYPGVYVEELPPGRTIAGVPTSITAFIGRAALGVEHEPKMCQSFAEFEREFGGLHAGSTMSYAVRDFFANGGSQALIVRVTGPAETAYLDGIQALEKADLFNILCIPPLVPGDSTPASVYANAAAYCRQRRAMLLVATPAGWDVKTALTNRESLGPTGLDRRNAAIYFPHLVSAGGTFVPCGAIAGIYAATDARRGVWKSPAGTETRLTDVDALSIDISDRDNGLLNRAGINCLRRFPGIGLVVWGARTMSGGDANDDFKYVPVRRFAMYLEESIDRGTTWTVFEPNDEKLWSELRRSIDAFMYGLFRQGAFQGRTQREAWFVKCGRETTTQADIDAGIVNITVGFAPLKPAEFVLIRIGGRARSCPSCP